MFCPKISGQAASRAHMPGASRCPGCLAGAVLHVDIRQSAEGSQTCFSQMHVWMLYVHLHKHVYKMLSPSVSLYIYIHMICTYTHCEYTIDYRCMLNTSMNGRLYNNQTLQIAKPRESQCSI